jgi:hypothetical protein
MQFRRVEAIIAINEMGAIYIRMYSISYAKTGLVNKITVAGCFIEGLFVMQIIKVYLKSLLFPLK